MSPIIQRCLIDVNGRPGYAGGGPNADFAGGITISRDAFAAKSWLSGLPFVKPGNIAVAICPVCYPVYEPDTPLLLLTGRKDEICLAFLAEGLKKKYVDHGWKPEMSLTVYPNAYHSFDIEGLDFESSGRHFRWDPEAASDAIARTKDFLSRYLEGGRQ